MPVRPVEIAVVLLARPVGVEDHEVVRVDQVDALLREPLVGR